MSRQIRSAFSSGFFHVMVQGLNKEYIFKEDESKQEYLNSIKKFSKEISVIIIAYCIMNSHAHFIFYAEDISNISKLMFKVNTKYAKYYNKKFKRVGYVFRDRFKSQYIYNRDYLLKCIKYIHMNPVKAKIVNFENQYKFSSYKDFLNKKGIVNEDFIKLIFGNIIDYKNYFISLEDDTLQMLDEDIDMKNNFCNAVDKYLRGKGLSIDDVKHEKERRKKFIEEMLLKGYKQKEIGMILEISKGQVSKIVNS